MLHLIMVISALIMTTVQVFGEFIKKALQDSGRYSVTLVNDQKELIRLVQAGEIQTAVLDMEFEPNPIELISKIRNINPELGLILFNNKSDISCSDQIDTRQIISYEGVLRTSDLLKVLERLTSERERSLESGIEDEVVGVSSESQGGIGLDLQKTPPQSPGWLGDKNSIAQVLTQLTLESAAHAALIAQNADLWAYAGHLSRPAAEELAQSLWGYWDRDGGSDLAQFILLESTRKEYILYATGLGGDFVLGLAFETAIPFSEMRTQAGMLAKRLIATPEDIILVNKEFSTRASNGDGDALKIEAEIPSKTSNELVNYSKGEIKMPNLGQDQAKHLDEQKAPRKEAKITEKEVRIQRDVQTGASKRVEDKHKTKIDANFEGAHLDEPISVTDRTDDDLQSPSIKGSPTETIHSEQIKGNDLNDESSAGEELEWNELFERYFEQKGTRQPEDPLLEWERLGEKKEKQTILGFLDEDSSLTTSNELAYACVLIPRLPHHYLMGDLANFLKRWIKLHAIAFGWRLGRLVVQRDSLQWIGILNPGLAPGQMVENLRIHSSKEIFSEFPRLMRENPSGDFWAGDSFIQNGGIITEQAINNFMEDIRSKQGINDK